MEVIQTNVEEYWGICRLLLEGSYGQKVSGIRLQEKRSKNDQCCRSSELNGMKLNWMVDACM